ELVAEGLIDIDELVAAEALRLEIAEDRLHRRRDVGRVGRLGKIGDLAPGLLELLGLHGLPELEDLSFGALPAELREETAADLEEAAVLFAALVGEPRDERRDVLGL